MEMVGDEGIGGMFFIGIIAFAVTCAKDYSMEWIGAHQHFSVPAKPVSCFKQYITAYYATRRGPNQAKWLSLYAFSHQANRIAIHTAWDKEFMYAWIAIVAFGFVPFYVAGYLSINMGAKVFPVDHAGHNILTQAVIIVTVLVEAALLIHAQANKDGLRGPSWDEYFDMFGRLGDTITIYPFLASIRTQRPWDAEKILQVVGTGLSMIIGAYHVGWILYKSGIIPKVFGWLMGAGHGFATKRNGNDGDDEEEGEEVRLVVPDWNGTIRTALSTDETAREPVKVICRAIHWIQTWSYLLPEDQRGAMDAGCTRLETVAYAFYSQAGWRHTRRLDVA